MNRGELRRRRYLRHRQLVYKLRAGFKVFIWRWKGWKDIFDNTDPDTVGYSELKSDIDERVNSLVHYYKRHELLLRNDRTIQTH